MSDERFVSSGEDWRSSERTGGFGQRRRARRGLDPQRERSQLEETLLTCGVEPGDPEQLRSATGSDTPPRRRRTDRSVEGANLDLFLDDPENGRSPRSGAVRAPESAFRFRRDHGGAPSLPVEAPQPETVPPPAPPVPKAPQAEPPPARRAPRPHRSSAQPRTADPRETDRSRGVLAFLLRSFVFAILLGGIWAPTWLYVTRAPKVYETSWRIILPGEGVKSALRLEAVGEAKTSAKSVFNSKDFDPRATYREIAASEIVRVRAAEEVGAEAGEFDKPKIKEIPQTAILSFKLRRGDPEQARAHALAYMAAFDARVDALRIGEISSRQGVAARNIDSLRRQLRTKRDAKLEVQRVGGLLSPEQFESLVEKSDQLQRELTDSEITLSELQDRFNALAGALGVTPQVASWALTLKSDRLFQSIASAYAEAETELAQLRGNLGERHPTLITTRVSRDELFRDLAERSRQLIGFAPEELSRITDLTQSAERSSLFASLLETNASLEGQRARVAALRGAAAAAQSRTSRLAKNASQLSAVTQEEQVAEAVYTNALASVDLAQTDPYASYPLYQVLDAPSLPSTPVSPKIKIALAGAAAATLFLILAFAALWYRRRLRRARSKRRSSSGPSD